MVKFTLHNHSLETDGGLSPLELIAAADRKDFGLISITDHDKNLSMDYLDELLAESPYTFHYLSDEACLIEGPNKSRIVVLKGNEITTMRSKDEGKSFLSSPYIHVLGIGYKGEVESYKTLEDTIKEIKEKDGIVIAPHPVAPFFWGMGEDNLRRFKDDIDAIELNGLLVYFWRPFNQKAKKLAKELDKPLICGGDSHFKGTYLEGFYNISDYKPKLLLENPLDWLKQVIENKEYKLVDGYDNKKVKKKIFWGSSKGFFSARVKPLLKRMFKGETRVY